MILVAGAGVGFWLILPEIRALLNEGGVRAVGETGAWLVGLVFILGGLSLVGPPLLLLQARGLHWGAGRLLWFAHGTAAWLLWPPIVYQRVAVGGRLRDSMSSICFLYGTPLMAVYMTAALVAGGYVRRSRRRRARRSWQEIFGLLLGLAWSCTGLYLISLFYRQDLFRR
jgi:hypothetical protein